MFPSIWFASSSARATWCSISDRPSRTAIWVTRGSTWTHIKYRPTGRPFRSRPRRRLEEAELSTSSPTSALGVRGRGTARGSLRGFCARGTGCGPSASSPSCPSALPAKPTARCPCPFPRPRPPRRRRRFAPPVPFVDGLVAPAGVAGCAGAGRESPIRGRSVGGASASRSLDGSESGAAKGAVCPLSGSGG